MMDWRVGMGYDNAFICLGTRNAGLGCTASASLLKIQYVFILLSLVDGFPEILYHQCARRNSGDSYGLVFLNGRRGWATRCRQTRKQGKALARRIRSKHLCPISECTMDACGEEISQDSSMAALCPQGALCFFISVSFPSEKRT